VNGLAELTVLLTLSSLVPDMELFEAKVATPEVWSTPETYGWVVPYAYAEVVDTLVLVCGSIMPVSTPWLPPSKKPSFAVTSQNSGG
jgi:hypothetical protein